MSAYRQHELWPGADDTLQEVFGAAWTISMCFS
jgi:hypothetical protein